MARNFAYYFSLPIPLLEMVTCRRSVSELFANPAWAVLSSTAI